MPNDLEITGKMYLQQKLAIKTSEKKSYQARMSGKICNYKVEEGKKKFKKMEVIY